MERKIYVLLSVTFDDTQFLHSTSHFSTKSVTIHVHYEQIDTQKCVSKRRSSTVVSTIHFMHIQTENKKKTQDQFDVYGCPIHYYNYICIDCLCTAVLQVCEIRAQTTTIDEAVIHG